MFMFVGMTKNDNKHFHEQLPSNNMGHCFIVQEGIEEKGTLPHKEGECLLLNRHSSLPLETLFPRYIANSSQPTRRPISVSICPYYVILY